MHPSPNTDATTNDDNDQSPESVLKLLVYSDKGNALLALGGMYTFSMSLSFILLYSLFSVLVTLSVIGVYTVFLFMFIRLRAPDTSTKRLSYILFIGLPYVFTTIGILGYEFMI